MLTKLIILFIIFINLKIPLTNYIDIFFVGILFLILISTKTTHSFINLLFKKKLFFLIIIVITSVNISFPKLNIEEAHSIFINENDIKSLNEFLPSKITNNIIKEYNKKFDTKRMLKAFAARFNSLEKFTSYESIYQPFAYSADSFLQNNKYSRIVNDINFSSREELRIGHLNTLEYNIAADKHFRRILPYYVLYELPKNAKDSKICSKGNTFYKFIKKNHNKSLKDIVFQKNDYENCIDLNKEYETFYFIGFSINQDDNLEIKLKKNYLFSFLDLSKYFCTILVLFIFCFYLARFNFNTLSLVYFTSFFATIIICFIFDSSLISGLRYFRGGADGLAHESWSRDALQHLANKDYFNFFQGRTNVFYFMPGLRYFSAISKIFFGETNYSYLLLATFLPFSLFIFFDKYLNRKYSLILFISFIFFPILENMGFGYFNYIWQIARNHAETLSIALIIFALTIIVKIDNNKYVNIHKIEIFLSVFLMSMAVLARPNFFPATSIMSFYLLFRLLLNNQYTNTFIVLFAYSFSFLALLHNYYYGNSFTLFARADIHFAFTDIFKSLNVLESDNNFIFAQIMKWNPLYNIHRLFILATICIYMFCKKQTWFTYALFFSMISQHGVLLLTHPDSRYAYLAWLLTVILFVKIEFDNKFLKLSYNKLQKVKSYFIKNR